MLRSGLRSRRTGLRLPCHEPCGSRLGGTSLRRTGLRLRWRRTRLGDTSRRAGLRLRPRSRRTGLRLRRGEPRRERLRGELSRSGVGLPLSGLLARERVRLVGAGCDTCGRDAGSDSTSPRSGARVAAPAASGFHRRITCGGNVAFAEVATLVAFGVASSPAVGTVLASFVVGVTLSVAFRDAIASLGAAAAAA